MHWGTWVTLFVCVNQLKCTDLLANNMTHILYLSVLKLSYFSFTQPMNSFYKNAQQPTKNQAYILLMKFVDQNPILWIQMNNVKLHLLYSLNISTLGSKVTPFVNSDNRIIIFQERNSDIIDKVTCFWRISKYSY